MLRGKATPALVGFICIGGVHWSVAAAADSDSPGAPRNSGSVQELPQVVVIGNAPLPGFGLPLNEVPANVQTADSLDLKRAQTTDIADYLNRSFSGVNVSESAANPFQLDINYHGFTASPLLGTPEGLSVYVDGVRVNESFGDTVNWDLIPQSAISTVSLMSGSNPVFGLNTLGGALSLQTKSGHDNPGTEVEAYGGSFGRRAFEGETGGALGAFDYFATVSYFDETGWRDMSPSTVWQAFGKVGWQTEKTDLDLSYTYADTSLFGNGAAPLSMLAYRRQTSYTPDVTHNLLHFVNLTGHAVAVGAPAALGQRLLPPPHHRQQQRQQQRQLPERGLCGCAARLQPAAGRPPRDRLLLPGRHPGRHAGAAHGRVWRAADGLRGPVRLEESGHRRDRLQRRAR